MSSNNCAPAAKRRFSLTLDDRLTSYTLPPSTTTQVCYGALHGGKAQCLDDWKAIDSKIQGQTKRASFFIFPLKRIGHSFCIFLDDETALAVADQRTQKWLAALDPVPNARFEALFPAGSLTKRQKIPKKGVPIVLDGMSVNIFGPQNGVVEKDAGKRLRQVSAFLQHPMELASNIQYYNPQFFVRPGRDRCITHLVGKCVVNNSHVAVRAKIANEVNSIFESLGGEPLDEGLQFIPPMGLSSELKRHQIQALLFVLKREPGNHFPQKSQAGVVTSGKSNFLPKETPQGNFGGLIADDMGMGKSLTILVSILYTLGDAETFADFSSRPQNVASADRKTPTRATLVVVSSAQLIDNWTSEIRIHMPGALKVSVFHGQNQPKEIEQSADVVLTTYATLASNHKKASVFYRTEWYRVVLDEAHWIRNSSSKQFKAAAGLSTSRRWCLTGTPIQNKLNDLASLAGFLRLSPYPNRPAFQKHAIEPLANGTSDPLRNYLRQHCLRRANKCLQIPNTVEDPVYLRMSTEEQDMYDRILSNAKRAIDDIVSSADKSTLPMKNKMSVVLFAAVTRLRRLCDLGTLSSSLTYPAGLKKRTEDCDMFCERCSSQDEDGSLLLREEEFCPYCSRPLCTQTSATNTGYLTPSSVPGGNTKRAISPLDFSVENNHCTKLTKVRDNVLQCLQTEPAGATTKHLIFSEWTLTLDYLAQLMQQAGISYVQIDGRTSHAERSQHLKAFQEGSQVSVLLMSIGTGAVGLTLTAASHVHIVEPQWNPSVEDQAIGRAHRMGQTKEVVVTRYIMQGTVEQVRVAPKTTSNVQPEGSIERMERTEATLDS
ncbi:SNF2 family N-terminal domain-containing protein [Pseudoneurospora amorphoporcata]|uniref:SNF2 family N-terminal domain-containing protein n=1 Tax=Pseudoneurospora amorphoporcata TaxID=241081 RepID=A0AAN6SEG9_9PEZI|nr:SNF2 family N-terminal domain-containing protein [Pseudoneurospora amorphoporcata]